MGRAEKMLDAAGGITEIDYDELNCLTDRYDSLDKLEHWTSDGMSRVDTHLKFACSGEVATTLGKLPSERWRGDRRNGRAQQLPAGDQSRCLHLLTLA